MPHKDPEVRRAYAKRYYKQPVQKAKAADRTRADRIENPEKYRAYGAAQRKRDAERAAKDPAFKKRLAERKLRESRNARGVSGATGERRVGACEVCGSDALLHLDHDHATGSIRGWLCRTCNVGIGALGDTLESLERAVAYLKGHPR